MTKEKRRDHRNDDLVEAAENCLPNILMFYRGEVKGVLCTINLENCVRCARISNAFPRIVLRLGFTRPRSTSPPQRPAPPGSP